MNTPSPSGWLILLHRLPTKPPYQRVKVWRRLQGIGAVPLKTAAHILPDTTSATVAFTKLIDEIVEAGGEATLISAELRAGQSNADVRALFDTARDADYAEIADAARRLLETGPATGSEIAKLRRRMDEVATLDFFGAHGRQDAEAALVELGRQRYQHPDVSRAAPIANLEPVDLVGKTWITRRGVHVDRIACAWLIRRFVDRDAQFRFVDGKAHTPARDELRFDMSEAEFTHEGDRCSFETIVHRARLAGDTALVALGEIIHDLDIADGKFGRPETAGVGAMLSGVCASTDDDLERISRASDSLDQFYAFFRSRKGE